MEFSAEIEENRRVFYFFNLGKSMFITLYNLRENFSHYSFLFLLITFKLVELMHL
jgi:hypothetical protein